MSPDRGQVLAQCSRLPAAVLVHPFGDDTAVFTVGGRMFALLSLKDQPGRVTVKCDPEPAAALVAAQPAIAPGYHMNKRHWVTVTLDPALPADLVPQLVEDSYDLVVAGLPARARPG